jgi:hypothetical protein
VRLSARRSGFASDRRRRDDDENTYYHVNTLRKYENVYRFLAAPVRGFFAALAAAPAALRFGFAADAGFFAAFFAADAGFFAAFFAADAGFFGFFASFPPHSHRTHAHSNP